MKNTYARSEEEVLVSCGTGIEFSGWKIPMPAGEEEVLVSCGTGTEFSGWKIPMPAVKSKY